MKSVIFLLRTFSLTLKSKSTFDLALKIYYYVKLKFY